MTILEPAQIEETILCDLKHSSAPVYVYIKATFVVRYQLLLYLFIHLFIFMQ